MSSEEEFKCVFCSEIFSHKEDLQIHFRKHADPNFNQKKQKVPSQDESDTSTDKLRDQMDVVECDVCSEVFTAISKAITHKHKMHPDHDTKYFCPWCGKLFTMKHLYKKHIRTSHSDKQESKDSLFHCDSCDVDFHIPSAMIYHNKFYHRQDELPSLGHSKKLKMVLEELVQIYYCPFCGEEHDNKVNLHKHINEDHSSENQSPNDVFRCPLCDGIFYYLDAYELHLTFHSDEDLYTERNPLLDEITDFSLETVQPLQESISSNLNEELEPAPMGIEDLLEFTMNDSEGSRKSKKHKKHKKAKKPAITLDEFLNMNKDVFGEGIDFQGVEEVPTQVIAKRFKTKKAVPASHILSPDIVKLKKQGIVIKKQPKKIGRPTTKNNPDAKAAAINSKNINIAKSTVLTSTDAVLSKLLNQGSQIKIIKKSNQDSEEPKQGDELETETTVSSEDKHDDVNNTHSDAINSEVKSLEHSEENKEKNKINNVKLKFQTASETPDSPSLIGDNNNPDMLDSLNHDKNEFEKYKSNIGEESNHSRLSTSLTENVTALQNNTDITLKLPKQRSETKEHIFNEQEGMADGINKGNDVSTEEDTEKTTSTTTTTSENSSLNALKHLSHLITVKSVNSNKTSFSDKNLENCSQKLEVMKTSSEVKINSSKKTDLNKYPNLKKLDGITIKPTNLNINASKNPLKSEINFNEHDEPIEECQKNNHPKTFDNSELTSIVTSPQVQAQVKHSPKPIQKEVTKIALNHDQNSQSSTDLLKHLKNVTAKPVNSYSQKIPTPQCSPSAVKKSAPNKTLVQKEISDDGTEIFSIDDSDSDEGHRPTSNTLIKTENKIDINKPVIAMKNKNANMISKSNVTNQQLPRVINKNIVNHPQETDDEDHWEDECDNRVPTVDEANVTVSPKLNQKNVAINNVLRNLSKNITVKSRNSSPSTSIKSQEHNSRDSHLDANEEDSDPEAPRGGVKITEMDNMSDDDLPEDYAESGNADENVKIEHPDDSHSEHDDEPIDNYDDIESQIVTTTLQKNNTTSNSNINNTLRNCKNLTMTSINSKATAINKQDSSPLDEIPQFAKNLSNQISIKQIKKPENQISEETTAQTVNQSSVGKRIANSSNQVNTFNKEVKTVKTFQTQTKTVIQEITTTVTKTIKTVNQTMKQEVRNMAQLNSAPMITQKIQGGNTTMGPRNYQGVKVRQSAPCFRPKVRGQAPQAIRPAICPAPQFIRPTNTGPVKSNHNQLVPQRPALNRPSGPQPRMPNSNNVRPSTSGQQRPQMTRPVKVSPRAVFTQPKKPAEPPGHFSCFKKPKESLIPESDFTAINKDDEDSVHYSSTMQMSKSNFSSASKVVKGNSVVTSKQVKSEMSASSQQLSKLRGMSGLVVKTSQSQAKQTQVEEKSEMSASKRNALEAIQKLQSQGLLVKKPRLDVSEDSNHSQHGSDDMGHDYEDEFDE